jgi:divalent metal cation (Fe/Co/Zn/Cd) transporter
MADAERAVLALRGQRLEYFTIAWNCLEGLIAVGAGVVAGSISLVGFGADSFIEVTSGAAVLWRMSADADPARRERREQAARRIVGACFIGLAVYVAFTAAEDLLRQTAPAPSLVGIVLAVVSVVIMPILSRAKRRVAAALNSGAMHADATQTDFCAYLSAILLTGLLLNLAWGVWWADPVAAVAMVPLMLKEGVEALRGDACAC